MKIHGENNARFGFHVPSSNFDDGNLERNTKNDNSEIILFQSIL